MMTLFLVFDEWWAAPSTHQVSVNKKHREINQNPGGQHEDNSVKAQDVEQPQVVNPCIT